MKKVSAGTILVNEFGQVLMGRVTNSRPIIFDIPKGTIENNEAHIDTAIREAAEEFNLVLNKDALIDLGLYQYNREKNLWVFLSYVDKADVDLTRLQCNSFFYDDRIRKNVLEICSYEWVAQNEVPLMCAASLSRVLNTCREQIMQESQGGIYRLHGNKAILGYSV